MEPSQRTPTTLVELLQLTAEASGQKPAFIFRDKHGGRRVLSWRQIYDLAGRFAAVLKTKSIGRGHLVVTTLSNSPERVVCEFGILLSGAASVNGQCQLADGSDLLHILSKSRASSIVLDPDVPNGPWDTLKQRVILGENGHVTSEDFPHLKHVLFARRVPNNADEDFLGHLDQLTEFYQADVTPDDLMAVFTTSGTTGFSKLVVYGHKN
ncbi:hypothetical protein BaRGS_00002766 [Batillaria attramentaria]|uniref:AMP-dependent synthetase/ligase domain-containing protein n=1 Tax=Batillaria attramentaria TaxID=370345 RepID=A0ABD0M2A3_9CAEN